MNKSGFVLLSQNLVNGLASTLNSVIGGGGQLENEDGRRVCVCLNYWGVMQKFNISTRHRNI